MSEEKHGGDGIEEHGLEEHGIEEHGLGNDDDDRENPRPAGIEEHGIQKPTGIEEHGIEEHVKKPAGDDDNDE